MERLLCFYILNLCLVQCVSYKYFKNLGEWKDEVVNENNTNYLKTTLTREISYPNSIHRRMCLYDDKSISSIQYQLVNGKQYLYRIRGCWINSLSNNYQNQGICVLNSCLNPSVFTIKIWIQLWMDYYEIVFIHSSHDSQQDVFNLKNHQEIEEEMKQIQQWIKDHDLNEYGDEHGTMYTGGNPLFNEETGESITLYEYLISQHPERPWNQVETKHIAFAAIHQNSPHSYFFSIFSFGAIIGGVLISIFILVKRIQRSPVPYSRISD